MSPKCCTCPVGGGDYCEYCVEEYKAKIKRMFEKAGDNVRMAPREQRTDYR